MDVINAPIVYAVIFFISDQLLKSLRKQEALLVKPLQYQLCIQL